MTLENPSENQKCLLYYIPAHYTSYIHFLDIPIHKYNACVNFMRTEKVSSSGKKRVWRAVCSVFGKSSRSVFGWRESSSGGRASTVLW